jgi:hypothetical protein
MKRARGPRVVGRLAVIGLTAAAAVLCSGALAAGPVKGSEYKGTVSGATTEKVSFKVSAPGTKVTNVRVTPFVPNKCGSGGASPAETSKPAVIKNGKFSAKLTEETGSGLVSGTATVTGKFLAGGKVKGLVMNPLPGAKECAGNFPYTAKAGKG